MEIKDINLDDYEISQQADEEIIVLRKEPKYPKFEDLEGIKGFRMNNVGNLVSENTDTTSYLFNKTVYLTEKHAKSALAMAQISQLMPYYGGEITDEEWENTSFKHVIERYNNEIYTTSYTLTHHFLAFHTVEQRNEFLKNNEQLVKDYLMID